MIHFHAKFSRGHEYVFNRGCLSKEQMSKEQMSRQPKCSRCRHHGIIVPQKGHTKLCPFLRCDCWKCCLVAERTRIQRGLKKFKNGEQYPRVDSTFGVKKPAAKKTPCAASGTSGYLCPTSGGVPVLERDTNNNPSTPLDLRSRPAEGRQSLAGLESRNGLPFASDAPNFGEFDQPPPPLPFIHFPFWMPGHYSGSYALCPNFMINMPPGLYDDALCGPLMFPHFQPGALYNPPPPEPGPPALSGLQDVLHPSASSAPRGPPGGQTH
ncbi:doublesex- and mab-3-related transcription factor C2-like [Labrus mixtus]|uniref:doublesex- and mab-3-related transcription factor C2-like n=1 Tax=Labrus mixtus TaxID=508554 RepID=UPI0029C0B752|nr:doublesex- and mab-3-related transcription factor C2-like [Labrus mixtus]